MEPSSCCVRVYPFRILYLYSKTYRRHSQLDSVHLFLAFSQTYPSLITPRYHAIPKPNMPLPSYLKSLTSHNHQWLTQLTLLDITIPRTALIQLSLVPNLSVLTIGPGVLATDIGVDDSLLRTWSRSVTTGAFSMLRALVLRSQPHVTARAFSYLAAFPVLSIFAIESVASIGPRDKPTALTYGWKYKTDRDLRDWLVTGGGAKGSEWDVISQAFFELGSDFSEEQSTAAGIGAADALPTIHLAVGGLPENALVDVFAREGAMRVWYRSGKMAASDTSNDVQLPLPNWSSSSSRDAKPEPQGTAAALSQNQTVPQKRPLDLQRSSDMTRKKTKPVMRASKRQNLDDLLLLGFGT